MSSRKRRHRLIALWALCCLLVSQWALASHVCPDEPWLARKEAQAQLGAASPAPACHGAVADLDDAPGGSDVLCMKHCADERSASGGLLSLTAAAAPPPPLLHLVVGAPARPMHSAHAQPPGCANATAPPLSILYCVFRT